MKQVVQSASGGPVRVIDVPRPVAGPTEVLVRTVASVISPGTERAVTELAQSSLLAKARARPDLARQVVRKARSEGVAQAARAVHTRLGGDIPLGYSAAGIAVEVGEHVSAINAGQLVATGGAGKANHAEFQVVPGLLCAPVPARVTTEEAALTTIAAIAVHGLRLADVGPGAKVVVIGLGLVGQLAVRLALASGCDVTGIDVEEFATQRAGAAGAMGLLERGEETTESVLDWTRGRGADAVLLTAATASSAPIGRTPSLCRDRASVVVVGDVGLELHRKPFYEKELSLRFARSYGPGRYDRSYEDWAVDYPLGHVPWTERRNQETVLDLLATGRLSVGDLVTHRFPLADAESAYRLVETRSEPYVGVALSYPTEPAVDRPITLRPGRSRGGHGVGLIGAGAFASTVLVPALRAAGFERLLAVTSASGLSARRLGERAGFDKAVSGADAVLSDPDVDVVVIATPHDTHASLAARALRSGKHVFCEKPLALTTDELDEVEAAWRQSGRVLFVGFNRRWSPAIRRVRTHFSHGTGPLVVTYRVSAGTLPQDHWYHDRRQGGRLVGEACHFVDTCAGIVGEDACEVWAAGTGGPESLLSDDLIVALRYPNGHLASITYASAGHVRTEKERIEVLGRGRSAAVRDFHEITLDGRPERLGRQDKGHEALVAAFRRALDGEGHAESALASSRATLAAASCLGGGGPVLLT